MPTFVMSLNITNMVISWTSYFLIIVIFLLAYYSVVLLLYFRTNIKLLLQGNRLLSTKPIPEDQLIQEHEFIQDKKLDATSAAPMHSLVDELQAYVSQAGQQGIDKDELYRSIKYLLQKYPAIKGSVFQEGITNLIAVISENNCAAHFSADELSGLWNT